MSKVLLIDIETSPNIGYTWGKYEVDVIEFIQQWQILCFAYKWLGERTECISVMDVDGEEELLKLIWKLLDEADVVIAQNGDRFDIPKINTRFLQHHMMPPSSYQTIDTLKLARKFAFNSNRLDDLGNDLGEGRKVKHEGFSLWKRCMAGDKEAWNEMKLYNRNDVDLLERIYLRFQPWVKSHPTVSDKSDGCPICGEDLSNRGFQFNKAFMYQRYQCRNGHWSKETRGKKYREVISG